jgi:hypothetical protein
MRARVLLDLSEGGLTRQLPTGLLVPVSWSAHSRGKTEN